jgi:membrane-bound lytic murein transglycosylase D
MKPSALFTPPLHLSNSCSFKRLVLAASCLAALAPALAQGNQDQWPPPVVDLQPKPVLAAPPSQAPALSPPAAAALVVPAPIPATAAAATAVPPANTVKAPVSTTEAGLDKPVAVPFNADLWQRIRKGFAMPDINTELVRDREQWYTARPDYIFRMTERARRYLYHVVQELELRGMPTELALLPFIESAFNPQAVSSAKAAGMWQFIPSTGKHFDLKQNVFRDERRDVQQSTRAALDYLQKLHGMFGDWHLALAAYNWGEGSVQRAMKKNEAAGLPTDYLSLSMPNETRYYVPKLQAVKNIIASPEAFSAQLPEIPDHPYFQAVKITRDIDVALAARLAEVRLEDFKALNPSASKPLIMAAGTSEILLPWDNAPIFQRNLEAHKGPLASWTVWTAPSTLRAAEAASRVGMNEAEFRDINRIPAGMLVKAGSTLLAPRPGSKTQDVTSQIADNGQIELSPEIVLVKRSVRASKRGDTVAKLAARYRIPAAQVANWNRLSPGAALRGGQAVVLYLPERVRVASAATGNRARASGAAQNTRVQVARATPAARARAVSAAPSARAKATKAASAPSARSASAGQTAGRSAVAKTLVKTAPSKATKGNLPPVRVAKR